MYGFVFLSILAFSGAAMTIFPYGSLAQKVVFFGVCAVLIVLRSQNAFPKQAVSLIFPLLLYILFSAVSALMYSWSFAYTLASLQPFFLFVVIFLWVSGLDINNRFYVYLRLFYVIVIAQFLFSLIKLYVHGIDEGFLIGTMSHRAGQLSILVPAIVVPMLVFLMNGKNQYVIYFLILCMFLFSIINEKRSSVFLLPIITMFSVYYIQLGKGSGLLVGKNVVRFVVIGLVVAFSVLLGVSFIPSLNVTESYGGSVSIEYAIDYAISYLTMDYGDSLQGSYSEALYDNNVQVGRITLLLYIFDWFSSLDVYEFLFGVGYGSITPSVWLGGGKDAMFLQLDARGAISGIGMALVETGVVGAGVISFFFIYLYSRLVSVKRKIRSSVGQRWFRMLTVMYVVFCFDFFFYSITLFRTMPMPFVFAAAIASIFIVQRLDLELFNKEKGGRLIETRCVKC